MFFGIFISVFLAVFLGIKMSKWDKEQRNKFRSITLRIFLILLGLGILGGIIFGLIYLIKKYKENISYILIALIYFIGICVVLGGIGWIIGTIKEHRKNKLIKELGEKGYEKYLKTQKIKKEKKANSFWGRNKLWIILSIIPALIIIPILIMLLIGRIKGEL